VRDYLKDYVRPCFGQTLILACMGPSRTWYGALAGNSPSSEVPHQDAPTPAPPACAHPLQVLLGAAVSIALLVVSFTVWATFVLW
jgi:hypothetical protein